MRAALAVVVLSAGCGRLGFDSATTDAPIVSTTDVDGDGHTTDDDCDDADRYRYPGAPEVCDDQDNDCDPATLEHCPFTCEPFRSSTPPTYLVCGAVMTWDAAQLQCAAEGFHLVKIDDALENAVVRSLITTVLGSSAEAYLGGTDAAVEGTWRWAFDGSPFWLGDLAGVPASGAYSNWATGLEPNDQGNEDAAVMTIEGTWNDLGAIIANPSVCERN